MDVTAVNEKLGKIRIVPVVAIESVDSAVPLADALAEGGLPVAEITFRTEAAADFGGASTSRPDRAAGRDTDLAGTGCGTTGVRSPPNGGSP